MTPLIVVYKAHRNYRERKVTKALMLAVNLLFLALWGFSAAWAMVGVIGIVGEITSTPNWYEHGISSALVLAINLALAIFFGWLTAKRVKTLRRDWME